MAEQTRLQAVNTFLKGLNKDADSINLQNGEYRDAWNIVDNTSQGNTAIISNEQGFIVAYNEARESSHPGDIGYIVFGHFPLAGTDSDGKYFSWEILFLKQRINDEASEIGIWDYLTNEYWTKVNDTVTLGVGDPTYLAGFTVNNTGAETLTFNINYQIDAEARQLFNLDRVAYFTDNLNPPRVINLDQTDDFVNIAQETQHFAAFDLPVCEFEEVLNSGNVAVGVYQFVSRYLSTDLTPTTFGIPCSPIPIVDDSETANWTEYDGENFALSEGNKSISISVNNLDTDFDFVETAVIYYEGSDSTLKAKIFNRSAISSSSIELIFDGSFPDDSQELLVEDIVQRPISYTRAAHVIQKDNRLLYSNLTSEPIDYMLQKVANEIRVKYEIKELSYDIGQQDLASRPGYKSTRNCYENKGYQRGEVYSLSWGVIFKDGSLSAAHHIPGFRVSTDTDYADWIAWLDPLVTIQYLKANTTDDLVGIYKSTQTTTLYGDAGYSPTWRTAAVNTALGITATDPTPIFHHYLPTLEQEPHFASATETDNVTELKVMGLVFENIDFGNIPDADLREKLKNQIQGIYFAREERDTLNKRSILAQGLHNKAIWCQSNDANYYNIIHLNPLNGDTDFDVVGAGGAHSMYGTGNEVFTLDTFEGGKTDNARYVSSRYGGFWSPDTILNPNLPEAELIVPEMVLQEDVDRNLVTQTDNNLIIDASWYRIILASGGHVMYRPYYGATESQRRAINKLLATEYSDSSAVISPLKANPLFGSDYSVDDTNFPSAPAVDGIKLWNRADEGYLWFELADAAADDVIGITATDINDTTTNTDSNNNIYYYPAFLNSVGLSDGYDVYISPPGLANSYTQTPHTRYLSNLRQELVAQYGSLDSVTYNIIEDLYFNLDEVEYNGDQLEFNGSTSVSLWKGDTFVCQFAYRNSWAYGVNSGTDFTYHGVSSVNHLRTVTIGFFESQVNAEYRHREIDEAGNQGAPYWPRFGNPSFSITDNNNVYSYDAIGGQSEGYNVQYSFENDVKPVFSEGLNQQIVSHFPTRTIYSQFSTEGEQQDRYRIFLPNDYYDLPRHTGEITNQFIWNQELYLQTSNGLWRTFFNSISAVASTLGEVYLGTGKAFSQPSQLLFDIPGGYAGCQHKWSSITTPFGQFFVDGKNKKVFLLTNTLEEISYEGRMSKWFLNNLELEANPLNPGDVGYNPNFNNNPANPLATGIVAIYDQRNRRIILGINYEADEELSFHTISFSFLGKTWRSFHNYRLACPFASGNTMVQKTATIPEFIFYKMNEGNFGHFPIEIPPYLGYFTSDIEFVTNDKASLTKTFSNQVVGLEVEDIDTNINKYNQFFSRFQFYNEFQNSGSLSTVLSYPNVASATYDSDNVRFVNREFRLAIPRDLVVDKLQPIDSGTNLYSPAGSVPALTTDYYPRIKGKYLNSRYTWNNSTNPRNKFTLKYVATTYRNNIR